MLKGDTQQFTALIDYLYDQWSVPCALLIFVLYVVPLSDFRAYVIVPLTVALIPLLATEFALFCHRRGILSYIYRTVHHFLSAAYIRVLFHLKELQQSKVGQFMLGLAGVNLGLVGYALYCNIDLLRLFTTFFAMLRTFVVSLRDPVAILHSFQELLRTLWVYQFMEGVRVHYVGDAIKLIESGSVSVVFFLYFLFVTGCLMLGATGIP